MMCFGIALIFCLLSHYPLMSQYVYTDIFMPVPDYAGTTDYIRSPECLITLTNPAPEVTGISFMDKYNNGNSSDVNVCMTYPGTKNGIKEFRLFFVKAADTAMFSLDTAMSTPQNHCFSFDTLYPSCFDLPANLLDSDGDTVANDVPYYLCVMTVPDSTLYDSPALSSFSQLTLIADPGLLQAGNITCNFSEYNDIVPDTILKFYNNGVVLETYHLDMNHDGYTDFLFTAKTMAPYFSSMDLDAYVTCYGNNQFVSIATGSNRAKAMEENELVYNGLIWQSGTGEIYKKVWNPGESWYRSDWPHSQPRFMGLRTIENGDTTYAWVRLTVFYGGSMILHDYASKVNNQTSPVIPVNSFTIHPNPASQYLRFSDIQDNDPAFSFEITDLSGKRLSTGNINNDDLYIGHLKSGMYIIRISRSSCHYLYKFIKQ
jgi:hypothetical protein